MAIRVGLDILATGNIQRAKVDDTVAIERLIRAAVTTLKLPSKDAEGKPITYGLRHKNDFLPIDQTLRSQNIRQDNTLVITAVPLLDSIINISSELGPFQSNPLQKQLVDNLFHTELLGSIQPLKSYNTYVNPILNVDGNLPARMPLDRTAPASQLIPAIAARLRLPTVDAQERPIIYHLRHNDHLLQPYQTLEDIGISNDDTLLVERQLPDISSGDMEGGGGDESWNMRLGGTGGGSSNWEQITQDVSQSVLISYHFDDFNWANQVATQLRAIDVNISLTMFDCAMHKGENFSKRIHIATDTAESAQRIIIVLSHKYLQSQLAQTQVLIAADRDPVGKQGLLLPIYVEDFSNELVEE